jgi:hypothetical protein
MVRTGGNRLLSECGDARISAGIGEQRYHGSQYARVSVPVKCGLEYSGRCAFLVAFRYPELKNKLAARNRIWKLEDLQSAIKNAENEVDYLGKYLELRKVTAEAG